MDYIKIYNLIIEKAQKEKRVKLNKNDVKYMYYENHHILAKCLDGLNNEKNLVLLNAKEHFVCHKLLTFIYPNHKGIAFAFHRLVYGKNKKIISGRDYLYVRELLSTIPESEETRKKRGLAISKALTGRKLSKQHKINVSKSCSGRKNGMFGKKHSNESIQKMKNRVFSEKTRILMSKNHANIKGKNNPMYGCKYNWITKNGINKRINQGQDLEIWFNNGWVLGKTHKIKREL